MKKSKAKAIVNLWNEEYGNTTAATKTVAVMEECSSRRLKEWEVRIVPDGEDNTGNTFFHVEEFGDIIRTFKVHGFITIEREEKIRTVGLIY